MHVDSGAFTCKPLTLYIHGNYYTKCLRPPHTPDVGARGASNKVDLLRVFFDGEREERVEEQAMTGSRP